MADPRGFLEVARQEAAKRPVAERVKDWNEVYSQQPASERAEDVSVQARRCMDCGIPFCHSGTAGCPLGNLIPEWNDLVRRGRWDAASDRLHATNNFPEFTGRVCPAPCESACVLSISESETGGSVTIKRIEQTIADLAWDSGSVVPQAPTINTGKRVAVVGSGPAGLAAAQQLTRAGHDVTVYERDDRLGGLLRYGIPQFKLEKSVLDQRLMQMRAEGTHFVTDCEVGVDFTVEQLQQTYDAVILAVGALRARDNTEVEGRELDGIHLAMEHLVPSNKECEGDGPTSITAKDKHVVIIGGGDTGADCLGTSIRQGARSITQLEIMPHPPEARPSGQPWPTYPMTYRVSSAHEEGGERVYSVSTKEFLGDDEGNVRALKLVEVEFVDGKLTEVEGTEREIPAQLVLFAMGFLGPEKPGLVEQLGVDLDERGNVQRGSDYQSSRPGVFVAGDAGRGQSLIVWAIAEGRAAASYVDAFLTGDTALPAPVKPTDRPLVV
nr:glutamate synthase subunit beta [uncultured Rhodococcus sp.]